MLEEGALERAVAQVEENRRNRNQLLLGYAQQLAAAFALDERVDKVILFGSVAAGDAGNGSDLDLAVVAGVGKDVPPQRRLWKDILLPDVPVGVDLIVYTPEEFAVLRDERRFVREEIVHKGLTLFERH